MTDTPEIHETSSVVYPDPTWFWLAYMLSSFVSAAFVCPMYNDFIGLLPIGYVLTTVAAVFTPRRSRTASRGITLASIGAIFPLAAVLIMMGVFRLFDLGGPVH